MCPADQAYWRYTASALSDTVEGRFQADNMWNSAAYSTETVSSSGETNKTSNIVSTTPLPDGEWTAVGALTLEGVTNIWTTFSHQSDGPTHTVTEITTCYAADLTLSGLTLKADGTAVPLQQGESATTGFAPDVQEYTASVANTVLSVTVTPTLPTGGCPTVTVGGTEVADGSASEAIRLEAGVTTSIPVVFTSGPSSETYTLAATRQAASVDATLSGLSNLTAQAGTTPMSMMRGTSKTSGFKSDVTAYTASVAPTATSVRVTPTARQADATVMVNGEEVASRHTSEAIPLTPGGTTIIPVVVIDGMSAQAYVIAVTRRAASGTGTVTSRPRDRTRPQVALATAATAPRMSPFTVTVRFSERVSGFSLTDIAVSNGTASHFRQRSSQMYTVTITPEASGTIRIAVGPNVAKDQAGNGNWPADPLVIEATLEAAALQGRFESPADGDTVSGIDIIRGWTFAEPAGVEIEEVALYIDGHRETSIPCCSARGDVHAAYPEFPATNTAASGWGLTHNWGELAAGAPTLRVVATSTQGGTWESAEHTIHVLKPGEVVFADRFSLATAAAWIEDEQLVLDRVVIRDKASQREREIEACYGWRMATQLVNVRLRWSPATQGLAIVGSETVP